MPLTMANPGQTVVIRKITGRDEVRQHLAEDVYKRQVRSCPRNSLTSTPFDRPSVFFIILSLQRDYKHFFSTSR